MVTINIIDEGVYYRLDCSTVEGKKFMLEVSRQGTLLKKPRTYGLEENTAYFHVKHMIENNQSLPQKTVAAWG